MPHNYENLKQQFSTLKANEILKCLHDVCAGGGVADLKPIKVAVLRSYTVEPLEPFLKLRFILEGYNPQFAYGGYNQFAQEILDDESFLYRFEPNIILFFMRTDDILPGFNSHFYQKPHSQWLKDVKTVTDQIGAYVRQIRGKLNAQIVCQNLSLEVLPYFGVYDAQQVQSQVQLVHEFNQGLIKQLATISNAYVWDYAQFLSRKGFEAIYDPKMWYVSRNPIKYSAYPSAVHDLFRYISAALGRLKKCIVLDLDNTLWGGIIGEDGFDHIQLGEDYPGACYRDFQNELLKLYNRGVLLAINSRNNEDDVFDVIDNHPEMVLRRKHFAAYRINWEDKATNLEELAEELNIGIESMIFIDDNPRECEFIRQMHPECSTIQLPEKKYDLSATIQSLPNIDNINITEEDRKKGEIYQSQKERRDVQCAASSLREYLRDLEVVVSIKEADEFSVPRIAQLTQKTNQLNMTTRRYTESQIESFINASLSSVFYVSVKDRLGDHGIVGVIILKTDADQCLIDTFLLSCRVLGLTIEETMITFIKARAKSAGCKKLIGEYIPTRKNRPAEGVYERMYFEKQDNAYFVFDLNKKDDKLLTFVKLEQSISNKESLMR